MQAGHPLLLSLKLHPLCVSMLVVVVQLSTNQDSSLSTKGLVLTYPAALHGMLIRVGLMVLLLAESHRVYYARL